jgi:hypothetical protein
VWEISDTMEETHYLSRRESMSRFRLDSSSKQPATDEGQGRQDHLPTCAVYGAMSSSPHETLCAKIDDIALSAC